MNLQTMEVFRSTSVLTLHDGERVYGIDLRDNKSMQRFLKYANEAELDVNAMVQSVPEDELKRLGVARYTEDLGNCNTVLFNPEDYKLAYFDYRADILLFSRHYFDTYSSTLHYCGSSETPIQPFNASHAVAMFGETNDGSVVESLEQLDLSTWDFSRYTDLSFTFSHLHCKLILPCDADVSKVKSMRHTFEGNINFDADLSNWDTSSLEDVSFCFDTTQHAVDGGILNWDFSHVTNADYMLNMSVIGLDYDLRALNFAPGCSIKKIVTPSAVFTDRVPDFIREIMDGNDSK